MQIKHTHTKHSSLYSLEYVLRDYISAVLSITLFCTVSLIENTCDKQIQQEQSIYLTHAQKFAI